MRTLYLSGLVILDLAVLALGAGMIASMDLDKAGTGGVLATVPVVLLVLSDFPAAHVALRAPVDGRDAAAGGGDRRVTVLLAAGLTAAGALPLLLVTAAAEGPVLVAAGCVALAALALVYAFRVGDRVASRRAAVRLTTARTLVPRRARRGSAPVPLLDAVARPTRSRAIGRRP